MSRERRKAQIASANGLLKKRFFELLITAEGTTQDLGPLLPVITHREGIVLDITRGALILTRQISETSDRLHLV